MRSLFVRIFISFWIAMTLISAGSALIYATQSTARWERWQTVHFDAFRQRVREELDRLDPHEADAVPHMVEALGKRESVVRVFAVAEGEPPRSDIPIGAQNLGGKAIAAGKALQERGESVAYFAEVLDPRFPGIALVEELSRPSPVLSFIGPDTLPFRLLVILVVSGLVCYGLARQLTRRLLEIRRASRRLAEGDLAVRIAPQLGELDDEATALARDLDQMAERIDALLGAQQRLLRDVSHELRSPLARLTIALELARQEAKGEAGEYHDRIAREAELLSRLIGEILTLTRLEGEAKPQRQADALDLSELVREVAEDADFEARPSQRRVEVISGDRITLLGYGEILRRAVENVVRNAVRFAPVESAVEVRLERGLLEGRPVARLDVRDRGPGVPDSYLKDIFQPFFRVSESRDRRSGGTGVGLAITERAVRLHGGSVMARNADGGGLIVSIALPLGPSDAAAL